QAAGEGAGHLSHVARRHRGGRAHRRQADGRRSQQEAEGWREGALAGADGGALVRAPREGHMNAGNSHGLGGANHMRMNIATSRKTLELALSNLAGALKNPSPDRTLLD